MAREARQSSASLRSAPPPQERYCDKPDARDWGKPLRGNCYFALKVGAGSLGESS